MELEGRLNPALSLPEVLQFLGMGKMTGVLTVSQGAYSATLTLRQGKLINSSSVGRPRRLGQMLVSRGLVERADVEDAAAQQRAGGPGSTPLGQILVQRGKISVEQLRQSIRLQLEEEIWELFNLVEGQFKFEHGDEKAMGDALVELDVEHLIIEGTRRLDEWARIVKNIPQTEAAIPSVSLDLAHGIDRDSLGMSDAEWRVLSLVNGYYDAGSLVLRSGVGKFETFRILNSFLASGLIVISATSDAPVAGERPPPGLEAPDDGEASSPRMPATGNSDARDNHGHGDGDGGEAYSSPAAFAAALANGLLDRLMAEPDFATGGEQRLAEQHWRGALMTLPKADLVRARGNRLDAARLDKFVKLAGLEGGLRQIHDDTVEAVMRYAKGLVHLASARLGQRETQALVPAFMEGFRAKASIAHGERFFFKDFAAQVAG